MRAGIAPLHDRACERWSEMRGLSRSLALSWEGILLKTPEGERDCGVISASCAGRSPG